MCEPDWVRVSEDTLTDERYPCWTWKGTIRLEIGRQCYYQNKEEKNFHMKSVRDILPDTWVMCTYVYIKNIYIDMYFCIPQHRHFLFFLIIVFKSAWLRIIKILVTCSLSKDYPGVWHNFCSKYVFVGWVKTGTSKGKCLILGFPLKIWLISFIFWLVTVKDGFSITLNKYTL